MLQPNSFSSLICLRSCTLRKHIEPISKPVYHASCTTMCENNNDSHKNSSTPFHFILNSRISSNVWRAWFVSERLVSAQTINKQPPGPNAVINTAVLWTGVSWNSTRQQSENISTEFRDDLAKTEWNESIQIHWNSTLWKFSPKMFRSQ